MSEQNTRERLLDAAEVLVANQGYDCTTLRQITQRAKANVAAVNYHFKSKKGLVKAMIERRLTPLDRIRHARLDEIQQAAVLNGRPPNVGEVLHGFIEPTLMQLTRSDGGRHFIRIVGRVQTEPDGTVKRIFLKAIRPVLQHFFETLCAALPDLPPQVVFLRMLFCIGAMSNTATLMTDTRLIKEFQLNLDFNAGIAPLMNELMAYVIRGMEAECVS